MLDDLRKFRSADSDPFQLIDPDAAVFILCSLAFALFVFRDYLPRLG